MINKKSLDEKLKHLNPQIKDLIIGMLKFNPYFRMTADDCLKHPIFDEIRIPNLEEPAN